MSWTNELYRVYELAVDTEAGKTMLPISHSTANAQVEVTVNEEGEFVNANLVEKADTVTIIPVTEDSASRGNGINPMPLADKLIYIAGDYNKYTDGKHEDNTEYFSAYMKQLGEWCKSEYSHFAITAIYAYLEKQQLIQDLVESKVIELDESSGKFSGKKINNIVQEDFFVRFIVSGKNGTCWTWKDEGLYEVFQKYYESTLDSIGMSYTDGKIGAITYKHPAKIRNSIDKAKLISANDTENYTYLGRFSNKEEAVEVSYDYSQKMHNALKWLINNQGKSYDSLTLITWNSALGFVPSITESAWGISEEEEYDSTVIFSDLLNKSLLGNKVKIPTDEKVMIMGLDAATTGRLSIAIYSELLESDFYANLRKWHEETVWSRRKYNVKQDEMIYVDDSCSLIQIAKCLYGTEREQKGNLVLNCDNKLIGDTILKLLPCVTEGKKLPHDVVATLVLRASSPLSYEKEYNHRMILENACALIKKEQAEHENKLYYKGEIKMAYDPTCTDRSYLFGCLLAIADKAESDTYEKDEKRVTNARRLWNAFAQHPYQTWGVIESRLEPYLEKDQRIMEKYTKRINEIMDKMSRDDFNDNSKLTPMYLIGFHHYNSHLWNGNKADDNKEEQS